MRFRQQHGTIWSHVQLLYTTKKHHPNSAFTYDQLLNVYCKRTSLNLSSTNQVVPGCDKSSQKVENSSAFCNKTCTGCAFYRPKEKSLCSRWCIYRVLRDCCVILANKKSVLTQHATTWFVTRQASTRVVKHVTSLFNPFCSNVAKHV